jgi:hypothetical protein
MPHKHNAGRRHHIPKMAFKVQNWPAHEVGLRRRGSLTLWIEDGALRCWQTRGPGRQAHYLGASIQANLMVRSAFKLSLRQTEGLMTLVLTLMGLTISVSVCRRQALSSSTTRRLRRRERMEMNAIATKAMRCSFERSKMVFNRRQRLSQAKDRSTTQPMPAGTNCPSRPRAMASTVMLSA